MKNEKLGKIEVSTPVGIITVEKTSDPAYPGVWVSLKRPEESPDGLNIALIECEEEGDLLIRVWGDTNNTKYVPIEDINKFFAKK